MGVIVNLSRTSLELVRSPLGTQEFNRHYFLICAYLVHRSSEIFLRVIPPVLLKVGLITLIASPFCLCCSISDTFIPYLDSKDFGVLNSQKNTPKIIPSNS